MVSYETMEQNGSVLMWYHAEGVGSEWVPQDIPEIQNGSWKYAGRSEHIINAHIQVIRMYFQMKKTVIIFLKQPM